MPSAKPSDCSHIAVVIRDGTQTCASCGEVGKPTDAKPPDVEARAFEAALPTLILWLVDEGCSCDEVGHDDPEPGDHKCTAGKIEHEACEGRRCMAKDAAELAKLRVLVDAGDSRASDAEWERDELRGNAAKLQARLRTTCQILVEAVGADGPCNAEDAATRAVAELVRLREYLEDKTIRTLEAEDEIERLKSELAAFENHHESTGRRDR